MFLTVSQLKYLIDISKIPSKLKIRYVFYAYPDMVIYEYNSSIETISALREQVLRLENNNSIEKLDFLISLRSERENNYIVHLEKEVYNLNCALTKIIPTFSKLKSLKLRLLNCPELASELSKIKLNFLELYYNSADKLYYTQIIKNQQIEQFGFLIYDFESDLESCLISVILGQTRIKSLRFCHINAKNLVGYFYQMISNLISQIPWLEKLGIEHAAGISHINLELVTQIFNLPNLRKLDLWDSKLFKIFDFEIIRSLFSGSKIEKLVIQTSNMEKINLIMSKILFTYEPLICNLLNLKIRDECYTDLIISRDQNLILRNRKRLHFKRAEVMYYNLKLLMYQRAQIKN